MKQKLRHNDQFKYKDISVRRDGMRLILTTSRLQRELALEQGIPITQKLVTAGGQALAEANLGADFSFIGINLPGGSGNVQMRPVRVDVEAVGASWRDGEHVRVDLTMRESIQKVSFVRSYFHYPDLPVCAVETRIRSAVTPNIYWSHRRKLEPQGPPAFMESCADRIRLAPGFLPVRSVEFQGRTDYGNDPVIEHSLGVDTTTTNGNLLFCESPEFDLFLLQEAPPSAERRDFEDHDFRIEERGDIRSCGWGIFPSELRPGKTLSSYRHVIGWAPAGQSTAALKTYLRIRFPQNADRDHSVMVNPWGVGSFPSLVNEQFLLEEIAAAADLGATHYQIDDGWQKGRSLAELVRQNRSISPDFWDISKPHLPHGFRTLHQEAVKRGIELALWVAPSYNCEYRDAMILADRLFNLHQQYGFRMFKIDAVKIRSKEAEDRLRGMLETLRSRSHGEILFNLDTTNGQRPGYFCFLEYGNIFLENRYVCHNFGVGYHPEETLRNLWMLSRYVRSQVLQIEIPDPCAVRHEFYREGGRSAPDIYPPAYWAVIAFFANPLLWFAPSLLDAKTASIYRKIIALHLSHRKEIFAGNIHPMGTMPNGKSLTGFISHDATRSAGWVLLFREIDSVHASASIALPADVKIAPNAVWTLVDSSESPCEVRMTEEMLSVHMEIPGSYGLLRYEC